MSGSENYKWVGPVGEDAITLKASLAKWLGPRLVFLADHTTTVASGHFETEQAQDEATNAYLSVMRGHGEALIAYAADESGRNAEGQSNEDEAHQAMQWVAENFINLWD
ncbi:hypothetical protein GH722_04825 [Alphaproteobacteria bacterium HT1-32]|nr:hypothetical protein [Alphaproteobacteria bacterium HT1-32]